MDKKKLQKGRMWKYFVEAATDIIKEEGTEHITIRKVADRAGYNSATIYNYFEEFSHLLFFASMRLMKEYTEEVARRIEQADSALAQYRAAWQCFSEYSFRSPEIFYTVFIRDLGDNPDNLLEKYYGFYPSDLVDVPEEIRSSLLEPSVEKRGNPILVRAVEEGSLAADKRDSLNEVTILIWQGMMMSFLNKRLDITAEEAHERTMTYILGIIGRETD
ncbi:MULTISPECIES: TetR/AcrR family transcriptional regulator [Sporosarcina]|uniref:TetR/AcrR family transcriptional regulator n=1 Tax=Sporosarcina TaxID=1569 RepID=UPI00058B8665|nr:MULTISPECIES: TetR/AcrR family transcriptional regulator [Sporosarcina]WJY28381.1 TetR/AcrR family transcriptional regulator [Sporosarcina sp. 0.2-SM1T-5]